MSFLLLWSLRATATVLLGFLLTFALRRRSAAVRSVALRAALLAVWTLPVAALLVPRIEVVLPAATAGSELPSRPGSPFPRAEDDGREDPTLVSTPVPAASGPTEIAPAAPSPDSSTPRTATFSLFWVEDAYLAVASGLVLRWILAMARLRRIARAAVRAEEGIALTRELSVPVTFGLLRPCILLPESSKAWPPARVRAAVLHERAHVRRRDWAWQTLAALFAALHWANPLAWLLARALRDGAEAAADDEVLAQMGPSQYARELLAVAETARPVGPALAMARRGGVRDRVVSILAANRDRRAPTRYTAILLFAALALASLGFAGLARKTRAVPEPSDLTEPVVMPENPGPFTLPDGREVELVEVREPSLKLSRAWKPTGDDPVRSLPPDGLPLSDDLRWRRLRLVVRVEGPNVEDPTSRVAPSPTMRYVSNGGDDRVSADGTRKAFERFSVDVPVAAKQSDVRIGFASGPFRKEPFKVSFAPQPSSDDTLIESGRRVRLVRLAVPFPRFLYDRDVRLAAFDVAGKRLAPRRWQTEPGTHDGVREKTNRYDFEAGDVRKIARLQFETRPLTWVRFSGVRLAAPTPFSRKVALTEIVGRDAAGNLATWSGDGKALPPTTDGNPFAGLEPERGERVVRLRFALDLPKGADPSVRFVVPPPVRTGAWGAVPRGRNTATLVLHVPRTQRTTDVRTGVADGPWQRFDDPIVRRPYAGRLRKDLHGIEVVLPPSLRKEAVELRAYNGGRRLDPYTEIDSPDETTKTLVFQDDPRAVTRFEVWHRPYRWQALQGVPLFPPVERAFGPVALSEGVSAELVGVWTPGVAERVWRPDGTASPLRPPASYDATVPIDRRGVLLAFRLRGARLGGDPSVRVLEAGGFRGSNLSALVFEGPGRLVWQTTTAPLAARSADVDVEFGVERWKEGAVMARGTGLGEASWRVDGSHVVAGVRYTALTVRPHLRFSPSRSYEFTPLDAKGKTVESFGRSMGADHTFAFSLTQPERVARWRFESRPREVVRFRGVRLSPLP